MNGYKTSFSLTDNHSRAHFHLRLLNACDPYYRHLSEIQHMICAERWLALNNMDFNIVDEGSLNARAMKRQRVDSTVSVTDEGTSFST